MNDIIFKQTIGDYKVEITDEKGLFIAHIYKDGYLVEAIAGVSGLTSLMNEVRDFVNI